MWIILQAEVSEASSGNPGIPPSSLTSFLRAKPRLSGTLIQLSCSNLYQPAAGLTTITLAPEDLNACMLHAETSSHSELQAALPRCCKLHDVLIGLTCAGVVVADFNERFLDSTYHSQRDTNSSVEAVTSAALVAARALHDLASGEGFTEELKASAVFVIAHFTNAPLHDALYCTCRCFMR